MAGIPPVFVRAKDIPDNPSIFDICTAAEQVAGRGNIIGAQKIGALWRIYPQSIEARASLLASGMQIHNKLIKLTSQNPFIIRGTDGKEIPATKLVIGEIPISYSNEEIEKALIKIGVKMRSKIIMERIRNPDGQLTNWISGRRIVWIDVPSNPLPFWLPTGPFRATLYYKERKNEVKTCRKCLKEGHRAIECPNDEICIQCRKGGHKKSKCPELFPREKGIDGDKEDDKGIWETNRKVTPNEVESEEDGANKPYLEESDKKVKGKEGKRKQQKARKSEESGGESEIEESRGRKTEKGTQDKGRIDYFLSRARSSSIKRKQEEGIADSPNRRQRQEPEHQED